MNCELSMSIYIDLKGCLGRPSEIFPTGSYRPAARSEWVTPRVMLSEYQKPLTPFFKVSINQKFFIIREQKRFFEKMNYLRETGTFDWLNNWAMF